jgi:hypothetical protein
LTAALPGQWKISMTLKAIFDISNRFTVTQEGEMKRGFV